MNYNQINIINHAVKIFNSGGIVIFPTDTAFGIGCRIDKISAIKKLLNTKLRPDNFFLPVLVSSITQAEKYFTTPLPAQAGLPEKIKNLMQKFWPGGLTIVYNANKEKVPELIRGKSDKVGLRMPNYKLLLEIITDMQMPIIGTSANFHKNPTPYSLSNLDKELIKQVDYVIPLECGGKLASTVVDCSINPWKIIRQGSVIVSHPEFISGSR